MSDHPTDRAPAPSSPGTDADSESRLANAPRAPKTGYDMLDEAVASVVEASRVVKSYHDELHAHDGPFARQTERISKIIKADSDLVLSHMQTLQLGVDAFGRRLEQIETTIGGGFARVDGEMDLINAELVKIKARVTELERRLNAKAPVSG